MPEPQEANGTQQQHRPKDDGGHDSWREGQRWSNQQCQWKRAEESPTESPPFVGAPRTNQQEMFWEQLHVSNRPMSRSA